MELRVLRLIFVASIFAFVLTVRTVAPIHAGEGDPADDPTPVLLDPATVLGEDPPIDPPPPDPPTEAPPVEADPPPPDPGEPPSTDPPPADTTETVEPPTEPPVEAESPPADPVEPAPTDPPAETVLPPPDPPVEAELPPADPIEPDPVDPPASDTITPPFADPSAVSGDPAVSDLSPSNPAASVASTHRSAVPVPPGADNPAQTATDSVLAMDSAATRRMESVEPAHAMALAPAIAAGAGLAGLAITNHAPSSVAVAIEFGRAGGGWAGALVFNLWLRRQMRERRMSQRRLADLAGVDHSTISRLLRQDRRPSLTTATKLARALKQVPGEQAEPATADYFERIPEETVFPARRVELALRADEMLNDEQVRRLMNIYLEARRRNQASAPTGSMRTRAAPARAAPDARG